MRARVCVSARTPFIAMLKTRIEKVKYHVKWVLYKGGYLWMDVNETFDRLIDRSPNIEASIQASSEMVNESQ